jgi:hypothetical protein
VNGIQTITSEEYHSSCALSSSLAYLICSQSPLHAWTASRLNPDYKRQEEEKFDIGTAAHALLLEGSASVAMLDYPDWRTKEAQEARVAFRAAGKLPILSKHWDDIRAMVAATGPQLDALKVDPPLFKDGEPEQSLFWEEDGIQCRARPDWLRDDRATIDDYKTTKGSANPESWTRTLYQIGADIQAAFYLRGLLAINLPKVYIPQPSFRFVVQEQTAPYALSVVSLGPAALEIANRKVEYAIHKWRECLEKDEWPGYPARVCVAEIPGYEETRWLEHEEIGKALAYIDPGDEPPF